MATETNLESELIELERQFWQAMKDKDVSTAVRLTDFPCIVTGPRGIGQIDEDTFRGMMKAPPYTLEAFELGREAKVRLVRDDVAIVAYQAHEELTVNGEHVTLDVADSSTWVRRDGNWLCAQHTEAIVGDPFGRDRTATAAPKPLEVGATIFTKPSDVELVATRLLEAPRELVWEMCTRPEHLKQWMLGPEGWTMPVAEIDLRPDGIWHFVWRHPEEGDMEMRGAYREVTAPERLIQTEAWGDDWPETLNTTILAEENGRTKLECTVLYPSKEARERALGTGMKEGWSASYDRLDGYLRALRSQA